MSKNKNKKKDKKKDRKLASQQVVTPMQSNDETPWVTNEVICQPTDSQQIIGQVRDQPPHDLIKDFFNVANSPEGKLLGDATKKGYEWAKGQQKKENQEIENEYEKSRLAVQNSNMSNAEKSSVMRHLGEAESTSKEKNNNKWGKIITGGIALALAGIGYLLGKQSGSGNQMNLMTMDDLIMKAPVKRELESHYFEVLRAIGEMGALKNEEKELWKQLQLLKKIFEALIFKGVYGCSLGKGAKAVKKLVNEIKKDPNGTGRWMKGLDGKEKLYHQVREICEYLDGHKNTTEIKQS